MTIAKIIRAWEDPEYRKRLSAGELAMLPENPVGQVDLTEEELSEVVGGQGNRSGNSVGCNTYTCVSTRGNSNQPCQNC